MFILETDEYVYKYVFRAKEPHTLKVAILISSLPWIHQVQGRCKKSDS